VLLQTITGNKDAARELRDRSAEVMDLIVDHLQKTSPTEITPDLERDAERLIKWVIDFVSEDDALIAFIRTLERVNGHIKKLKHRKGKLYDVLRLKAQLSSALSLFGVGHYVSSKLGIL
jgi:hypothetical protein